MIAVTRSKPIPVSTWRCGSGTYDGVIALGTVRVELDENQIPNLDATRVAFIDKRAARVAVGGKIDVHFRARPAWAGIAHHPEIVGLAAVET